QSQDLRDDAGDDGAAGTSGTQGSYCHRRERHCHACRSRTPRQCRRARFPRRREPHAESGRHGRDARAADGTSDMSRLSHINEAGDAVMVDVSDKAVTARTAVAEGFIAMASETLALVTTGAAKKGDVPAAARLAGIMAAKRTHELIPLCHPLAITKASVDFEMRSDPSGIAVTAEVKVSGQTGVEMEALTAVSVACLT